MDQAILVDTSTLLSARFDRFGSWEYVHERAIEVLILFPKVYLDGPSIERNLGDLGWLLDTDDGIEIVALDEDEVDDLYAKASLLAERLTRSTSDDVNFLRSHLPPALGNEFSGGYYAPSTYWSDLARPGAMPSLEHIRTTLEAVFGENLPFSGTAYVTLTRALYYQAMQESLGSHLYVHPTKSMDASEPDYQGRGRAILDMFDQTVHEAFLDRRRQWLGEKPKAVRLPMLSRMAVSTAERNDWSLGRSITTIRESPEAQSFRAGLAALCALVDTGDLQGQDAVIAELSDAAEAWSVRLGGAASTNALDLSVSLPFVGLSKSVRAPSVERRTIAKRLLVFMNKGVSVE